MAPASWRPVPGSRAPLLLLPGRRTTLALPPAGGAQHEQSALERELAAGREAPRAITAADREAAQRVEANVRHVLRQVR